MIIWKSAKTDCNFSWQLSLSVTGKFCISLEYHTTTTTIAHSRLSQLVHFHLRKKPFFSRNRWIYTLLKLVRMLSLKGHSLPALCLVSSFGFSLMLTYKAWDDRAGVFS